MRSFLTFYVVKVISSPAGFEKRVDKALTHKYPIFTDES